MVVKSLQQLQFYLSLYEIQEGTAQQLFAKCPVKAGLNSLYKWKRLLEELGILKFKSILRERGIRDRIIYRVDYAELDRFFFADEFTRVLYSRIHKVSVLPRVKPHRGIPIEEELHG